MNDFIRTKNYENLEQPCYSNKSYLNHISHIIPFSGQLAVSSMYTIPYCNNNSIVARDSRASS